MVFGCITSVTGMLVLYLTFWLKRRRLGSVQSLSVVFGLQSRRRIVEEEEINLVSIEHAVSGKDIMTFGRGHRSWPRCPRSGSQHGSISAVGS